MSAAEYYGTDNKQTYNRPTGAPTTQGQASAADDSQRGFFSAPQQSYYQQSPPQYQYQNQAPPQQQQYYQQGAPQQGYYGQQQQQPIYVQQPAQSRNNSDCLTACLAGMCLCCTLDMLF